MSKNLGPGADLENAMAEALAAVESRSGKPKEGEEPEAVEVEVEGEGAAKEPADEPGDDEIAGLKEQLMRLAADFQNFRKRSLRELDDARRQGSEKILVGLLPVLDNLERALAHSKEDQSPIAEGVRMVAKQFVDVLGTVGVIGFESVGELFDPERHEAMGQLPTADAKPGTVLEQMLKGYFMNDRLLRPAQVLVAAAPADDEEG